MCLKLSTIVPNSLIAFGTTLRSDTKSIKMRTSIVPLDSNDMKSLVRHLMKPSRRFLATKLFLLEDEKLLLLDDIEDER